MRTAWGNARGMAGVLAAAGMISDILFYDLQSPAPDYKGPLKGRRECMVEPAMVFNGVFCICCRVH